MKRRDFILGSGAGVLGASLFPSRSHGTVSGSDRKFIFVHCPGGWDPAMVFCPHVGDGDVIDRESDAATATAGDISYVSSSRTVVNEFFERWHDHMLLFNGLEVRNIDHWVCTILSRTGDTSGELPDWATIIAQQDRDRYLLPHFCLGGPAFAGPFPSVLVSSSGGRQLEHMLDGRFHEQNVGGFQPTSLAPASRDLLHEFAAGRQQALLEGAVGRRKELLENTVSGMNTLLDAVPYAESLRGGGLEVDRAVNLLSEGLVRCVSMSQTNVSYDTHVSNFYYQGVYQTELFTRLTELMELLESTPGTVADTLMEETTVVVHSEMGKTPQLNGNGKDHWPFTTTMLLGSGFTPNRTVGAYTGAMGGSPIDLATGELFEGGTRMTASTIGATLLAMADIDPGDWALDSSPILGVLA